MTKWWAANSLSAKVALGPDRQVPVSNQLLELYMPCFHLPAMACPARKKEIIGSGLIQQKRCNGMQGASQSSPWLWIYLCICVHLSWRTRFTRRILARSGSKSRELSVEALAKWNSTHALQPLAPSPFHFCNIGTSQRNKWATMSCTHKRIKMFARRRAVLRRCSYNNNIRYWRAGVYIHFMYYKRRTKRRFVCCMLIAWWFRNWKSNAIPVW